MSVSGANYGAAHITQTITVVASLTPATVSVDYALAPVTLNLTIDGMYITQAVQTYGGGVPLVAGRDGLLRVFVKSNFPNSAQPAVRVRFYNGAALLNTITIPAPATSVPTTIDEGTLNLLRDYRRARPRRHIISRPCCSRGRAADDREVDTDRNRPVRHEQQVRRAQKVIGQLGK